MVRLTNYTVDVETKDGEEAVCSTCESKKFIFSARAKDDIKAYRGCNILDGIFGCFLVQCVDCKIVYLLNCSDFQLEHK